MIATLISVVAFAMVSLINPAALPAEEPFIVYEDGEEFYVEDSEAYIDDVCSSWKTNGYYPDCGAILEEPGVLVTVTMQNGNEFQFYNDGDWARGDLVALLLYDEGTAIVYDDTIIGQPIYAGWISNRELKSWVKTEG